MSGEKVMVGMSGGVDSSVSAALLTESGYDVAGVTLNLHGGNVGDMSKVCGATTDAEDARAVCGSLGIPHYVFDFRQCFSDCVINNFITEYFAGRTPNPCIVCNRHIKFEKMLQAAGELGFQKIATGHYANVRKSDDGRYLLCRAMDSDKDQTYVLYSLTQNQLSKTVFPLGNLSKPEVRKIAGRFGFVNASKPDSQDICFVPDGDYASYIERAVGKPSENGEFVDINGNVLGSHNGVIRYTIGQRKGLGIALGKPAFVIEKDVADNRVILGDEELLFHKKVLIENLNFIPFDTLTGSMRVTAKLRYRHREQPAVIYPEKDGRVIAEFDEPQRAPSPGQSAVFYDGDIVVGGGIIVKGFD